MWQLNCDFDLFRFKHQFAGVRALAGVDEKFPGTLLDINALRNAKPRVVVNEVDRGIILADEMGLGKTVQAVAAIVLRNAIAAANHKPEKPSLVCLPNDAVLDQWRQHLQQGGIPKKKIIRFKPKKPYPLAGDAVYLCTRFDFQTEMKYILESLPKKDDPPNRLLRGSVLFPQASEKLLQVLKNQQQNSSGKAKNKFNLIEGRKHKINEVVRHYLDSAGDVSDGCVFRTLVIDEAHFLKSLKTYWGMCAGLVGLHAERVIPMTGTPYNNNCQDLATLMTFIQASHDASKIEWWDDVTSEQRTARLVRRKLEKWASHCILRREKDVIESKLPKKFFQKEKILESNLTVYEEYEAKILTSLKQIWKLRGLDGDSKALNDALRRMLAMADCMQQALIHGMLPGGGRQLSVLFSPSLSNNRSVKKKLEKKNFCVQCGRRVELTVTKARSTATNDLDGFNDKDDDDEEEEDDAEEVFTFSDSPTRLSNSEKGSGDVVSIPTDFCRFAEKGINHFACRTCLDKLKRKKATCRMCENLLSRLRADVKRRSENKEDERNDENESGKSFGRIHCEHIFGGFTPTIRLQTILTNFKAKLPKNDKVIILSFFKGSLDLLERMFHDAGVNAARYDGDVDVHERQNVLEKFKNSESSRVLLMTVQTGGTGLNIIEANHVWFVDRYWNPMVMKQAEDRCFRIGQNKTVHVSNHDTQMTFDDVMCYINEAKSTNAAIVLSDKLALQNMQLSYKDMSGFLGEAISRIREARRAGQSDRAEEIMTNVLAEMPADQLRPFAHPSQDLNADAAISVGRHSFSGRSTPEAIDLTSDEDNPAPGHHALSVGVGRKGSSSDSINEEDEDVLAFDKGVFANGFFAAAGLTSSRSKASTYQPTIAIKLVCLSDRKSKVVKLNASARALDLAVCAKSLLRATTKQFKLLTGYPPKALGEPLRGLEELDGATVSIQEKGLF